MIREGDVLTVEPARPSDLRVGDIALHRLCDRQLAAHRVVGRTIENGRPILKTRGDAPLGAPDSVREEDVLGRVTERERGGRVVRVDRGMPRVLGRLLIALVPIRALAARVARACRRLATRHGVV